MDQNLLSLYVPVQQAIVSYWMGILPPPQTCLLLYINERTLRYGKASERIPKRHFLDGVRARETDGLLHNGVKISHASFWEHINALHARELIEAERRARTREGNRYALRVQQVMDPVMTGKLKNSSKGGMRQRSRRRLKVGKGRQKSPESDPEHVQNPDGGSMESGPLTSPKSVHRNTRSKKGQKEKPERFRSDAERDAENDSVAAAVAAAKERYRSVRKAKAQKADKNLTKQNIKAAWEEAIALHAGEDPSLRECSPPTEKTLGIFRQHYKRYANAGYGVSVGGLRSDANNDDGLGGRASSADQHSDGDHRGAGRPGTHGDAGRAVQQRSGSSAGGSRLPGSSQSRTGGDGTTKLAVHGIVAFFARVIGSWRDLRRGPMNWYSSMPTVPHFDFVAYNVRHLVKGLRDLDKGVEMKSISEATEKSDKPKLSRKQRRRQNRGDVFDMVEGQFKEQHDE